jgi:hypothetical protein
MAKRKIRPKHSGRHAIKVCNSTTDHSSIKKSSEVYHCPSPPAERQTKLAEDYQKDKASFLKFTLTLAIILAALWHKSFHPDFVPFANDGPLGLMEAAANKDAGLYQPRWDDLNGLGFPNTYVPPSFTVTLTKILGNVYFLKFFPPISSLILGCSMWLFLNKLKLVKPAVWFGGLAASLNSDFFSYAAWGLGTLNIAIASVLFAMTILLCRTEQTN